MIEFKVKQTGRSVELRKSVDYRSDFVKIKLKRRRVCGARFEIYCIERNGLDRISTLEVDLV